MGLKVIMKVGPTAGQGLIEEVRADAAEMLVATGQAVWADGAPVHSWRAPPGGYGIGPKPSQVKDALYPGATPKIGLTLEERLPPYPGKASPTEGPDFVPPPTPPVMIEGSPGRVDLGAETMTPHTHGTPQNPPPGPPVMTTTGNQPSGTPNAPQANVDASKAATGTSPATAPAATTVPKDAPASAGTGDKDGGAPADVKDVTPKGDGGNKRDVGKPGSKK